MDTLELLVKLASFGTAGVSIFAVFYVGISIRSLPNNAPPFKVSLLNKYLNFCVIIAIICSISGGMNAYFNQTKIADAKEEANNNINELKSSYDNQLNSFTEFKKDIQTSIDSLDKSLSKNNNSQPNVRIGLINLDTKVKNTHLKSSDELTKDIIESKKIK
jgi:hypothetical protein